MKIETATKTIKPKFDLGDIVFLVTDPEQRERMVVQYMISAREIFYILTCGAENYTAPEMEIAESKQY